MATKMLESSAVSAFCESVAVMHSAGIQMDEAVFLLGENMEDAAFKRACDDVYKELIVGKPLALAMDDSGCFPSHVVDMAGAGEHAGRLENVLWSLARYYDEEDRLYAKIKNAIAYPAALLCVMSAILLFTVIVILPVFVDVYHGLTGNLTAGSFGYVNASIIIGWIALGVTLLCTVLVVLGVLAGRSAAGRQRLLRLFEKAPLTRGPMRQMAVSRFTAALATFVAAGRSDQRQHGRRVRPRRRPAGTTRGADRRPRQERVRLDAHRGSPEPTGWHALHRPHLRILRRRSNLPDRHGSLRVERGGAAMNSTNGSVRIGPISLFTLVIILCLAVMAVLSATTAQATYSAAEKQALFTNDTYQNEQAAQSAVAVIDAALESVRASGGGLDEALAAVDEALPADAQRDGSRVLMTFASPSGRTLDVELTITANATYEISQWKATTQWTNDGPGATLWSGAAQTR